MPRLPTPTDVFKAAQAQTEAVLALPGLLIMLTQQVRALTESLAALQRLAIRVDSIVDDLEPGLHRLAVALDNPAVDGIPETFRQISENALPMIRQLRDTQARIATIADSTQRLTSFPTALLAARRRGPAQELPTED